MALLLSRRLHDAVRFSVLLQREHNNTYHRMRLNMKNTYRMSSEGVSVFVVVQYYTVRRNMDNICSESHHSDSFASSQAVCGWIELNRELSIACLCHSGAVYSNHAIIKRQTINYTLIRCAPPKFTLAR